MDERQVLRCEAMLWEMQLGSTPILRDRNRKSVGIAEGKIQQRGGGGGGGGGGTCCREEAERRAKCTLREQAG